MLSVLALIRALNRVLCSLWCDVMLWLTDRCACVAGVTQPQQEQGVPAIVRFDDFDVLGAVSEEFRQNVCELLECDTSPGSESRAQLESALLMPMDLNSTRAAEWHDVRKSNAATRSTSRI